MLVQRTHFQPNIARTGAKFVGCDRYLELGMEYQSKRNIKAGARTRYQSLKTKAVSCADTHSGSVFGANKIVRISVVQIITENYRPVFSGLVDCA